MALENDGAAGAASAADLMGGAAGAGTGADAGAGAGSGGDAGAGAGADAGAGGDQAWLEQFSTDAGDGGAPSLRDWITSAGVKDVNGLAKMARDNMAAVRDGGRIKVPGDGASEAEVKAFRTAIGVPDDVSGYVIEPPKGEDGEVMKGADGEPVKMSPVLDRLAAKALAAGVPAEGYKAIVGEFVAAQLEELGALDARLNSEAAAKVKEWGDKAPANQVALQRALEALDLNRNEVLAIRRELGAARAMDVFAKLGNGIAEDVMTQGSGDTRRFGMTAAQAQARIGEIKNNDTARAKAMTPGTPENAEWNRLNDVLGEEANRKFAANI